MRPRPRFVEPTADFPSDEQIEQAAPSMAEIDRQIRQISAKFDAEFAELLSPDADTEERPQSYRYKGGARHVPPQYDGTVCTEAGPARRRTSLRVVFQDGFMTSVKARLLKPVTC